MASTYSTNLAIELIGTGEQSGTWGTTTNTNLGTLIEQSISGYVTQAITDGSGANTTITIPNGTTGVARNMYIEMTGALTFSTTSLIVPANKKLYFIFNNTSGGFAVTVKVSGQTGVLVPNGKKVILTSNGTDIVEAANQVVGNFAVGGALAVTGAATVGTTLVVSGGSTFNTSFGGKTLTSAVSAAYMIPWIGDTVAGGSGNVFTTTGLTFNPSTGAFAVPGPLGVTGTATMAAINASGAVLLGTYGVTNGILNTGNSMRFNIDSTNTLTGQSFVFGTNTAAASGGTTLMTLLEDGSLSVTGTASFAAGLINSGTTVARFQSTTSGAPAGSTGSGVEIYAGNIFSYNRTTSAFVPLTIETSALTVNAPITITGTSAGNMLKIVASASGTRGDATYQSWYRANGTTRKGYFGFAGADTPDITMQTEEAGGTLQLLNNTKIKIGGGTPMTNYIGLGQISNNTTYSVITFNEVYTAEGFSGVRGGVAGDLFLNVPTGSAILGRVNNVDVCSIGADGISVPGVITFGPRGNASSTARISVSGATTLSNLTTGGSVGATVALYIVNGYNTGGAGNSFVDIVAAVAGAATSTISSIAKGSPAARTYSMSGSSFQLAMASGTYNVAVTQFEQSC